MKKTFLFCFSVFLLITTYSCTKENEPNNDIQYFQFDQNERSKLLVSYDVGKEFVYKNQDNQQMIFKVISSETGKTGEYSHNGLGPVMGPNTANYNYDHQEILLEYNVGYVWSDFYINIMKYPAYRNTDVYPYVFKNPKFGGYFKFPLWNDYKDDPWYSDIFIDFTKPTSSMTINGKNYTKVYVFESSKTVQIDMKNVNKIYYDLNAGVIQFNDLNGKEWLLQ